MITGYMLVQVGSDFVTADMIVWNLYRRPAYGIVEAMLDVNPQLAYVHRLTPFIPPGVFLRVPVDPDLMKGTPPARQPSNLWPDISTAGTTP